MKFGFVSPNNTRLAPPVTQILDLYLSVVIEADPAFYHHLGQAIPPLPTRASCAVPRARIDQLSH